MKLWTTPTEFVETPERAPEPSFPDTWVFAAVSFIMLFALPPLFNYVGRRPAPLIVDETTTFNLRYVEPCEGCKAGAGCGKYVELGVTYTVFGDLEGMGFTTLKANEGKERTIPLRSHYELPNRLYALRMSAEFVTKDNPDGLYASLFGIA